MTISFQVLFRCPRPLNRGVRLIKVPFKVNKWNKFGDLGYCPLNRGCPLNTVSAKYRFHRISFSAHFPSAGGLGHVPSPSLVFLEVQPPISNPCSTLAIFLFNETKNKGKIKPIVIYPREIIEVTFLFVLRWIFIDAAMPFSYRAFRRLLGILKGRINSDWQGYSPLTPNANVAIKKGQKTAQHIFHSPSELKVIVCHVYPVEDCVKGLHGNLFKLPYT